MSDPERRPRILPLIREKRPSLLVPVLLAEVALLTGTAWAFTRAQRLWILERDDYTCQYPTSHQQGKLHAHHIYPEAQAKKDGWAPQEIDSPYNAITICETNHVAKEDGDEAIHPPFLEMIALAAQGLPYVDDSLTDYFRDRARENTDRFIAETGKQFPQKRTLFRRK